MGKDNWFVLPPDAIKNPPVWLAKLWSKSHPNKPFDINDEECMEWFNSHPWEKKESDQMNPTVE